MFARHGCHFSEAKFILDAATLREDLAVMEKQIRFNPKDNDLINRYLTYSRKVREIEYRENGYVTARNRPTQDRKPAKSAA